MRNCVTVCNCVHVCVCVCVCVKERNRVRRVCLSVFILRDNLCGCA
jgi:hypothetical protein